LVFDSGPHRRSEGEPSCSVSRLMFLRVLVGEKKKNGPEGPPKDGGANGGGESPAPVRQQPLSRRRGVPAARNREEWDTPADDGPSARYAHGPASRPGHAIGGPTSG
jgi:hypothetical protein